jgi:hypothetical protein
MKTPRGMSMAGLAVLLAAFVRRMVRAREITITVPDAPAKQEPWPALEFGLSPREFGERYRYHQRKARKQARNCGVHPANPKRR